MNANCSIENVCDYSEQSLMDAKTIINAENMERRPLSGPRFGGGAPCPVPGPVGGGRYPLLVPSLFPLCHTVGGRGSWQVPWRGYPY